MLIIKIVLLQHGDSSPLCYAVQSGNITIVEMLIQNKTNVDPPQEVGCSHSSNSSTLK